MFKDKLERRSYRKSPGRQYEYEHDPLHGQERAETSTLNETWDGDDSHRPSHPGGTLSPRPDPRRTRQLMRKSILASKSHTDQSELDQENDYQSELLAEDQELEPSARSVNSPRYHSRRFVPPPPPRPYNQQRYEEQEEAQIAENWIRHGESVPEYMDPDMGYGDEEDLLEERIQEPSQRMPSPPARTRRTRALDEDDEDALLREELNEKKRKAQRRKFLIGAVAVGGTAVAAYELLPRLPQVVNTGAANIEHQLQQAFDNGVAQGAEAAKRELLNSLDTIEGFSLGGAITAAQLTRRAYDVFVSPLVTLAATVADDFLTVTLNALITARKWLAQINEDSPTLAALQKVLQSWVDQAQTMPQKIQSITDTDLDGAQAYLRALQQKIQEDQASLNGQSTPTSAPTPKP